MKIYFCLLLALSITVIGGTPFSDNTGMAVEPADYVFTGGKVYTVNEKQAWAEAVAVDGKKIVYVGDNAGAKAFVGDGTKLIDLNGKMMLPGFVDNHIHPIAGGFVARGVNLESDNYDEILQRIRDYAASIPNEKVVIAHGWRMNMYPDPGPTKEVLDKIDSERPIFLWCVDGHSAWVNSKTLELAGITKDTPDTRPPFSYFKRDEEGNPTGWIVEIPAQLAVLQKLIDLNANYIAGGVKEWFPKFSKAGITTVFDAGIQGMSIEEGYDAYQMFEKEGKLSFRVIGSYYWNDPKDEPLPKLNALMARYQSELVNIQRLKINIDGGDDKHNAVFVEPYSDKEGWRGEPIIPVDMIRKAVVEADAAGIDCFAHSFGDGAVRIMLDAVEAAIKANPDRDRRHVASHDNLIHPTDLKRFKELGVVADFQTNWAARDPLLMTLSTKRLGAERVGRMIAPKSVMDAGGRVTISSDWPVAGYTATHMPLVTIQGAVTRQLQVEPRGEPLGGEEARLSVAEAIKATTLGSAYSLRMEKKIGSLEVGKMADLIVLEKDLFKISMYEIGTTSVLLTMMNGKVTHQDGLEVTVSK